MIVECTRGFGKVEHPKTREEIDVEEPFETDEETFELLNEAYPGFKIVDSSPSRDSICGVEKANGEPCERTVESGDTCWQH